MQHLADGLRMRPHVRQAQAASLLFHGAAIDQANERPANAAPVEPGARLVKHAAMVGLEPHLAHAQFGAISPQPLEHPVERQIRQAPVLVAAADVGVHAGEPYLLDGLIAAAPRQVPNGGLKFLAMLVDGQRLAGVIDDAAQLGIVKLKYRAANPVQPFARNTQRAHGVEDTQKPDANVGMTELAQLGVIGGEALLWLGAIITPGKLQVAPVAVLGPQQTTGGNKAAQAARREGTARIAEQVDVIAGL